MLFLVFELNHYPILPYPKENLSFKEHTLLSVYIKELNLIYLNIYSLDCDSNGTQFPSSGVLFN